MLITLLYKQNNTYVTYNMGYLCWQYNTEYSYLQKMQLLAIGATYTTNNIGESLFTIFASLP